MSNPLPPLRLEDLSHAFLARYFGVSQDMTLPLMLRVAPVANAMLTDLAERFETTSGVKITPEAAFLFGLDADARQQHARILAVLAFGPVLVRRTNGVLFARMAEFCGCPEVIRAVHHTPLDPLPLVPPAEDLTDPVLQETADKFEGVIVGRIPDALQLRYRARADIGKVPATLVPPNGVKPELLTAYFDLARHCHKSIEADNAAA